MQHRVCLVKVCALLFLILFQPSASASVSSPTLKLTFGDDRQPIDANVVRAVVPDERHAELQRGCRDPRIRRINRSSVAPRTVCDFSPSAAKHLCERLHGVPAQVCF